MATGHVLAFPSRSDGGVSRCQRLTPIPTPQHNLCLPHLLTLVQFSDLLLFLFLSYPRLTLLRFLYLLASLGVLTPFFYDRKRSQS